MTARRAPPPSPLGRACVGVGAALVVGGAGLAAVPPDLVTEVLGDTARRLSDDGDVTPEGFRQLALMVRLTGVSALALGGVLAAAGRWLAPRRDHLLDPGVVVPSPPAPAPMGARIAVGVAAALSFVLAWALAGGSLTYDEAFTVRYFVHPDAPLRSQTVYLALNNHLLLSLLSSVAAAFLGPGEVAWRAPSLVAIALLPVAGWLLARRALPPGRNGAWGAVAVAFLLALAPVSNDVGASARGYALLVLFVTLQSVLLLRALERPGWGRWWAWALAATAAVWAHFFAVVAVYAQLAALVAVTPGRRRRVTSMVFLLACWLAVLGMVVHAGVLLRVMFEIAGMIGAARGAEPPIGLVGLLAGLAGWATDPAVAWAWLYTAGVWSLAVVGAIHLARDGPRPVLAVLATPVVAALLAKAAKLVAIRFVLFALPLLLVLAGVGVGVGASRRRAAVAALACVTLTAAAVGGARLRDTPRAYVRAMAGWVDAFPPDRCLLGHWDVTGPLPAYGVHRLVEGSDPSACPGGTTEPVFVCQVCDPVAMEGEGWALDPSLRPPGPYLAFRRAR